LDDFPGFAVGVALFDGFAIAPLGAWLAGTAFAFDTEWRATFAGKGTFAPMHASRCGVLRAKLAFATAAASVVADFAALVVRVANAFEGGRTTEVVVVVVTGLDFFPTHAVRLAFFEVVVAGPCTAFGAGAAYTAFIIEGVFFAAIFAGDGFFFVIVEDTATLAFGFATVACPKRTPAAGATSFARAGLACFKAFASAVFGAGRTVFAFAGFACAVSAGGLA
jgi:hypothetical protein